MKHIELIRKTDSILHFMEKVYFPMLQAYAAHFYRIKLNARVKEMHEVLAVGDAGGIRDYSERLALRFNMQIQSEHWKNASLSIEVAVLTRPLISEVGETVLEDIVHYHLSDCSD